MSWSRVWVYRITRKGGAICGMVGGYDEYGSWVEVGGSRIRAFKQTTLSACVAEHVARRGDRYSARFLYKFSPRACGVARSGDVAVNRMLRRWACDTDDCARWVQWMDPKHAEDCERAFAIGLYGPAFDALSDDREVVRLNEWFPDDDVGMW